MEDKKYIVRKDISIANQDEVEKLVAKWINEYKLDEKRFNIDITIDDEIHTYEFYKKSIIFYVKAILTYNNGSVVTLYHCLQNFSEYDDNLFAYTFIDDEFNGLVDITNTQLKKE